MTPFLYFADTGKAMLITNLVNLGMTKDGIDAWFKD
jgi:hypothetical protein